MDKLFELPFYEYMARRTKYAIDRMQKDNLITVDGYGIANLQAMWAREYWINKNDETHTKT